MESSKMKALCGICKHYRTIVYADGSCAMGCLKASENGEYPVDIRRLDACPRTHKKRRKVEIDSTELLRTLGSIYAECAVSASPLSLYRFLDEAGGQVKKYKSFIGAAIVKMEVLQVISRGTPGRRGNICKYKWNTASYGPPSLALVDNIIDTASSAIDDEKIKRKVESVSKESPKSRVLAVDEGVTSCDVCWLRDCPDCHDKLVAMGLDCKKMNINTIRYGKSTVG